MYQRLLSMSDQIGELFQQFQDEEPSWEKGPYKLFLQL